MQEQIERNVEDLTRGDISVRSSADTGLLYRSDEGLRGGIIGMSNIILTVPGMLIQTLEIILENERENREEQDG